MVVAPRHPHMSKTDCEVALNQLNELATTVDEALRLGVPFGFKLTPNRKVTKLMNASHSVCQWFPGV